MLVDSLVLGWVVLVDAVLQSKDHVYALCSNRSSALSLLTVLSNPYSERTKTIEYSAAQLNPDKLVHTNHIPNNTSKCRTIPEQQYAKAHEVS